MSEINDNRPDPDALLNLIKKEEERSEKGKLKIFFGMCAGVGKTYTMLSEARDVVAKGIDVVIGYVETHKRMETAELVLGLEVIPRKKLEYRGTYLEEMDIDAVLARKPKLVLVDELAHTNAPGSRHAKRYQDVLELLDAGIDVYTTLNVQHLESRADAVAQITGTTVRETVPDSIFESADEVKVIDISPEDLLKRLSEGKVYTPDRSRQAVANFFREGNLAALREMSLRLTAERVDRELREYMRGKRIAGPWKSGQRLIAAISPSPHSVSVIRWARRVSYTMDASWVVVYVERSAKLTVEEKDQLAKNMKLAKELGAEVVTTSDENIADALMRVAHEQNAGLMLVGKPDRTVFSRAGRLVDEVIQKSKDLDIYIVGQEAGAGNKVRRMLFPGLQSSGAQYSTAIALVFLTALLCYPLTPFMGYRTVSFIILLVVSLLPLRMGPGPTLLGAAIGVLAWDFLFIPPRFTFSVGNLEDALLLSLYFLVASVTGVLSARVRKREKLLRQREEKTSALFSLTKDLSSAHSQDEVMRAAVSNLKKYFNADVAVILGDTAGEIFRTAHDASTFFPDAKEMGVAEWVYWNEKRAGKNTDTLPSSHATYFPMSGPRYPLGVIGVKFSDDTRLSLDQESLLENFISQITSAIERELLNEVNKKSIVLAESERLYKTLFNSISHEFRTPIATIMGMSENLLSAEPDTRDRKSQISKAKEIHIAAERLNRLVANLLDMTRLESGMIQPKLDWCDVRDIVSQSIRGLERELMQRTVSIKVEDDVPLLRLDFVLIEQALTNLIHNSALYTPKGTEILVRSFLEEGKCAISVADCGPGLQEKDTEKVFEKFYRAANGGSGGTGLGLTIAKGFVEAHHGKITARNRPEGGAEFTIYLPIDSKNGIKYDGITKEERTS
ncbi:MAG TPA: sensor histidine kinase KdpD [Candidatus Acidoferrales bacterium]|nr:sensor histidine kinase KdpD [Candidatus Acidoferrales bacterium]